MVFAKLVDFPRWCLQNSFPAPAPSPTCIRSTCQSIPGAFPSTHPRWGKPRHQSNPFQIIVVVGVHWLRFCAAICLLVHANGAKKECGTSQWGFAVGAACEEVESCRARHADDQCRVLSASCGGPASHPGAVAGVEPFEKFVSEQSRDFEI